MSLTGANPPFFPFFFFLSLSVAEWPKNERDLAEEEVEEEEPFFVARLR